MNSAAATVLSFKPKLEPCALCHTPAESGRYQFNGATLCKDCHWAFQEDRQERTAGGILFYGAVSLVCWLGVLYSIIWLWHLLDTSVRMAR